MERPLSIHSRETRPYLTGGIWVLVLTGGPLFDWHPADPSRVEFDRHMLLGHEEAQSWSLELWIGLGPLWEHFPECQPTSSEPFRAHPLHQHDGV